MAFDELTDPTAVQKALDEYRTIGRRPFLKKYKFGASRGWVLVDSNGVEYDAKAILGAAHAYQYPTLGPLLFNKFRGGAATASKLGALGFNVPVPVNNPTWSRDEIILALDLYFRLKPSFPTGEHPDVLALSQVLNRLARLNRSTGSRTFRNGNGVAMKIQNLRRFDPSEEGKGLPGGGKAEAEIWALFAPHLERLKAAASAIRAAALSTEKFNSEADDGEEAEEGEILTRLHRIRERSPKLVQRRKAKALHDHGLLNCEACNFNFGDRYGQRGNDFIECHHTKPVSALLPGEKTKLQDLVLLCANCHRIVHLRRPWLSIEELKKCLQTGQ